MIFTLLGNKTSTRADVFICLKLIIYPANTYILLFALQVSTSSDFLLQKIYLLFALQISASSDF